MKLIKAKIYGFGKWVDTDFAINEDYQIIFGNNEAGKTTFLNFIKSILFGFSSARGANKYLQFKPKNSSNYGGELEFVDEKETHWTVRRVEGKGDGELTLYRGDQQVPENLISEITGNFTKEDFEATHFLDDETIRKIYDLDQQTLETEILALGAAGAKEWLQTADDLESDGAELYKPRGKNQPLAQSINRYNDLKKEKSGFENQQQQYLQIKEEQKSVNDQLAGIEKDYQTQSQSVKNLQALVEKLPKYQEYQQLQSLNLNTEDQISNDDWETFLKLEQQIDTLEKSQKQESENKISNEESEMFDGYLAHQADIDYVNDRRNDIQNLIFSTSQLHEQLRKSDYESDQLQAQNPKLSDGMSLLSRDEINSMQQPESKNGNVIGIAVALIAILFVFFVPGFLKAVFGIVAVGALGWWFYQTNQAKTAGQKQDQLLHDIFNKHNYPDMSLAEALAIQDQIKQLQDLRQDQADLEKSIAENEASLNKWKELLQRSGIIDIGVNPDGFIPELDNYFNRLNTVKTKREMIEQDQKRRAQILQSNNQDLSLLRTQEENLLQNYKQNDPQSFSDLHQAQLNDQAKINQLKADRQYLGTDLANFEKYDDLSQLPQDLQLKKNELQETELNRNQLLTKKGSLDNQMKQVFDDSAYQQLIDDLTQVKADIITQYDDWLSDQLASKWIHEMLNLASENRYPKMLKRAKGYFMTLTNGNYIDINIANKGKLALTRQDKVKFDVHELSKATTVQLYISLRLAFIVEISDLVQLPILIDDAFVDFDQTRTNNVFQLIQDVAKDNQIILVTANLQQDIPEDHLLRI